MTEIIGANRAMLEAYLRSPLAKFQSWRTPDGRSPQGDFLRGASTHRHRVFRSGNRVGKTTIGGVDMVLQLLGWHPWSEIPAPLHAWASGLDWEFGIGQVLWPSIRGLIPPECIQSIAWMRRQEPSIPMSIIFRNGSQLDFKSADSGRRKYQGAELQLLWLDEEHPEDVVEEAKTRLLRTRGYMNVTLTPLMRMRWVQELERAETTLSVRASMREAAAAGLLPIDAVEQFAASLPERQRRVRVDGDFVALEGMVYPDLNRERHMAVPHGRELRVGGKTVCEWPLPSGWRRWASIDWGMANPTACVVAAEDPRQGRLIVERCYYSPGIRASVWARLLKDRLPELVVPLISDHDAQARAECEAAGLYTSKADKEVEAGIESVDRLLNKTCDDGGPGLMFVTDGYNDPVLGRCDAEKVLWEGELYHYARARPDRPDPKDVPVKKDDHSMDALRYLAISYERGAKVGQGITFGRKAHRWTPGLDAVRPRGW